MAKLNQIIAIEQGVKNQTHKRLTDAHHALQKPTLLSGLTRTYQPKDAEGDQLPSERTLVQVNASDALTETATILTELFDITATKDVANCAARADVVVDGTVILHDIPATYLLFLEKQLVDIHTFVSKIPVLDPSEKWTLDPSSGVYATEPVSTTRTKKVMKNHEKAPATDKHPAQVDVYTEDVVVGYWRTIKFSGALPATRVNELLRRVEKLQQAVKFAREEANSIQVAGTKVGAALFGYLFAE